MDEMTLNQEDQKFSLAEDQKLQGCRREVCANKYPVSNTECQCPLLGILAKIIQVKDLFLKFTNVVPTANFSFSQIWAE